MLRLKKTFKTEHVPGRSTAPASRASRSLVRRHARHASWTCRPRAGTSLEHQPVHASDRREGPGPRRATGGPSKPAHVSDSHPGRCLRRRLIDADPACYKDDGVHRAGRAPGSTTPRPRVDGRVGQTRPTTTTSRSTGRLHGAAPRSAIPVARRPQQRAPPASRPRSASPEVDRRARYVVRVINFAGGRGLRRPRDVLPGPAPFTPARKETWTLTCESPVTGKVGRHSSCQIDRGQRKASASAAAAGRSSRPRPAYPPSGGVKRPSVGPAKLGRTRKTQRRKLRVARLARGRRTGLDRYCVQGGGLLRVGYPTKRLNSKLSRKTRKRYTSRSIFMPPAARSSRSGSCGWARGSRRCASASRASAASRSAGTAGTWFRQAQPPAVPHAQGQGPRDRAGEQEAQHQPTGHLAPSARLAQESLGSSTVRHSG